MDMISPEAADGVLRREAGNVVANASVLSYTEITEENIGSFHFHGDPAEFPIDAILAVPYDQKSELLLRGRYLEEEQDVQMLVPKKVMANLLETVFTVRDYVVIAAIVVGISTLATTILVFLLSLRLRRREIETIRKIGGTRRRVVAIVCSEILFVLLTSGLLALGLTLLVSRFSEVLTNILIG
jgi:putative ABC transport system permease protein